MNNPRRDNLDRNATNSSVSKVEGANLPTGFSANWPPSRWDAVAAAVIDADGTITASSARFDRQSALAVIGGRVVAEIVASSHPKLIRQPNSRFLACASTATARGWQLLPELGTLPDTGIVATSINEATLHRALTNLCGEFGMTPLQNRLVLALVETGSLRRAAAACAVSYHSARETKAAILQRLGHDTGASAMQALIIGAFGLEFSGDDSGLLVADWFGLTPRQLALAIQVAEGASRAAAAQSLGISDAVAKKELALVFEELGVVNVIGLSRAVAEARILAMLTTTVIKSRPPPFDALAEPIAYVARPDGTRIAYSDYGPPDGAPIFVLHSSMTNRPIVRPLLGALHNADYRPIAIDRPGYGNSDPVPGLAPGKHDPFATAAADMVHVCAALGLNRVDLAARGAGQVATALYRLAPQLLNSVVLVNPDPPLAQSSRTFGPMGAVKRRFASRPGSIAAIAKFAARFTTPAGQSFLLKLLVKDSPPDKQVMANPANIAEYSRGTQSFAVGQHDGFINEQTAFANAPPEAPTPGTNRWTVLIGGHDFIHDPLEVFDYWRAVLPDAHVEIVPDAGRFLAISHANLIISALRQR